MKYLAILKDSLREALDSKILLVLLALSTLVILVVATFSFKSLSAERTMGQFFPQQGEKSIPLMTAFYMHKSQKIDQEVALHTINLMSQFKLVKVELVKGEPDD